MKLPLISRPRVWHWICCLTALLGCLPLLWPRMLPRGWRDIAPDYAGSLIMASFLLSCTLIFISSIVMLLHLRNLRTLVQLFIWFLRWLCTAAVFCVLAYFANVPRDVESVAAEVSPVDTSEDIHFPIDSLTGPESLVIPIVPEQYEPSTVSFTPNLSFLENKYPVLLRAYVDTSPRWSLHTEDDNFSTKPAHVVMIPPTTGGTPGVVHVAFRHLVSGEQLPVGYTVVKPGDPMPCTPEGSEQVPDLALDLGGSHYLLLAWRGTSHAETAHRAINAAIATVDSMLQPLVDEPSEDSLKRLLSGTKSMDADQPQILLSEPATQYGTYQAEVHVNPGEAGTLILRILDMETNASLRLFSFPALFSDDKSVLFRHDIPGSIPTHLRDSSFGHVPGLLPENAPVFTIKNGVAHQAFAVALELWFVPAKSPNTRRFILRRCYRVQAFESSREQ